MGRVMKKYLFGFGAGLMFVLMHGEVSADSKDADCEIFNLKFGLAEYCKIKNLTCVTSGQGVSCVKTGMFR